MPIESPCRLGPALRVATNCAGEKKLDKENGRTHTEPTKCATLRLAEQPLKLGDCYEGFSCHSLLQRTKHDQGTRSRRPRVSDPRFGDRAGGRLLYGRDPQSDRGRVG